MNSFPSKNFPTLLLILVLAFFAGVIGGLFGTGGGILIMILYSRIFDSSPEYDRKDIFAMSVLTVSIMSLSSLFSYIKNGAVAISDITPTFFPAIIGGMLGAFLLDRIKTKWLNRIFAILVIYAGITLIFR